MIGKCEEAGENLDSWKMSSLSGNEHSDYWVLGLWDLFWIAVTLGINDK